MTTVLFTQQNSIYKELNTDCWDKERDATKWPGGEPIIAHPPCRGWGDHSWKSKATPQEKYLAVWAIEQIQKWGGVLEHPKNSKLWQALNLPKGTKIDEYGGWTLNIDQKWFGHRAKKNTNLYIVGTTPKQIPSLTITLEQHTNTIEKMGKKERNGTPEKLAKWLIELIEIIKENKYKK